MQRVKARLKPGCAYESDISYLTEVDFFLFKKMTLSVIIDVHEASLFATVC